MSIFTEVCSLRLLLLILVLVVENSILMIDLLLLIKRDLIISQQELLVCSLRLTLGEVSAFKLVIIMSRRLGCIRLLVQLMES